MLKKLLITAISASTCLLAGETNEQQSKVSFEYNEKVQEKMPLEASSYSSTQQPGFKYAKLQGQATYLDKKFKYGPIVGVGKRSHYDTYAIDFSGQGGYHPDAAFVSFNGSALKYLNQHSARAYLGVDLGMGLAKIEKSILPMVSLHGLLGAEFQTKKGSSRFVQLHVSPFHGLNYGAISLGVGY